MSWRRSIARASAWMACALGAVLGGCAAAAPDPAAWPDATVRLHTGGDGELGVSTDYGVVFLGRGARSGVVEFEVRFGDGPGIESGIVEALGAGLYVTQAEILLPSVALSFEPLPAGTPVLVRGRDAGGPWEHETEIVRDPQVEGVLLAPTEGLRSLGAAALGAGAYVRDEERLALVGLITGRLQLAEREYVTAAGPDDLWRLVAHARDSGRPRRTVPRGDIVP